MTARDVQNILGARVLAGEKFLDREVRSACEMCIRDRCLPPGGI